jgi:monoamine oxidase
MGSDIIIIGAGAAGIAAARRLQAAGHRPLILEARNRVGGRAWTDTATFGFPVDRGCQWLHSADRNPWMFYAREHGFEVIKRSPAWRQRIGAQQATPEYLARWHVAFERNEALIAAAANAGRDVAVAELVPDDEHRPSFDTVMTWLMGADSERVSSVDFARYADSNTNWYVRGGLGAVVAHAAGTLDIRLNAPVREIDHGGPRIRLIGDAGVIEANAAIVTVPTNVLAEQSIRFLPELPLRFAEALAGVPLGVANKVFFQMAPGRLPYEDAVHFIGTDRSARTAAYSTHPSDEDVLLAYFGGNLAIELEQRNELEAFARDELSAIFGSRFPDDIRQTLSTAWAGDLWARGSYSAALPGKAHEREQLNEALNERIFFAGEACSLDYFGTIMGAWHSGVTTAEKALLSIRR